MTRKDLEASWKHLEQQGYSPPRRNELPFVPATMPNSDDDELGFEFFRTKVIDESFALLTLPRTFFGRSLLERVDFRGTDLHESRMCWNDFVACNFADADLHGADFRASVFTSCSFKGADLRQAELRNATFDDCDFTGAQLDGAHLRKTDALLSTLSVEQGSRLIIEVFAADEPPGG